jgi:signal transduction histidine kinase
MVTESTTTATPSSGKVDYMMQQEKIASRYPDHTPTFIAGVLTERARIGRDLHDTLLQSLAGLAFEIAGVAKIVRSESDKKKLQQLRAQAHACLREARQAVCNIREFESESLDLAAELRRSGERLSTEVDFSVEGVRRQITSGLGEHLLRIGKEAMANAARHSCAEQIRVRLNYGADSIGLEISDNGNGFDPEQALSASGHFGLRTMRERAQQIRASITIVSNLTRGTRVQVTVPTRPEKHEIEYQSPDS